MTFARTGNNKTANPLLIGQLVYMNYTKRYWDDEDCNVKAEFWIRIRKSEETETQIKRVSGRLKERKSKTKKKE